MTFEIRQCTVKVDHQVVMYDECVLVPGCKDVPCTTYYAHYRGSLVVYSKLHATMFRAYGLPPTMYRDHNFEYKVVVTRPYVEKCCGCDMYTHFTLVSKCGCEHVCRYDLIVDMQLVINGFGYTTTRADQDSIFSYRVLNTNTWLGMLDLAARVVIPPTMCIMCLTYMTHDQLSYCPRCIAYLHWLISMRVMVYWAGNMHLGLDLARSLCVVFDQTLRDGTVYQACPIKGV